MPTASNPGLPVQPTTVQDTRLPSQFINDLVLKVLYLNGSMSGKGLSEHTCLAWPIIEEALKALSEDQFCQATGARDHTFTGGDFNAGIFQGLTNAGVAKAKELILVSQYAGPAPITMDYYMAVSKAQAKNHYRVTRPQLEAALAKLILPPSVLDQLGPGLASRQPIFLYGPPGNGKSTIAISCAGLLGPPIFLPHAIYVKGEVIRLFDPAHHHPVRIPDNVVYDRRWIACQRPVVIVGGELTKESLELSFDPHLGFYEAPLQMKANGGMFLIDDFGRQEIRPSAILNRLIVPLETHVDYLNISRAGTTIPVPFDEILMISTNLDPKELMDDAFLRRIHYKVEVPDPTLEDFARIFKKNCEELHITYNPAAVEYLLTKHYDGKMTGQKRPRHGCDPRDILNHLIHVAEYLGQPPQLTPELIDRAVATYFTRFNAS